MTGAQDEDPTAEAPAQAPVLLGSTPTRGAEGVKSAIRVLDIFEFFSRFRQPARGFEIANFLGIPKSSANGLLKTLVDAGYLTFNVRSKAYFPSFRMVRFGSWLSSFYFGPDRIIEMIEDLRSEAGESVGLLIQNGFYMQFVASLPKQREVFAEGMKVPILTSAAGGALLMTFHDEDIAKLVHRAGRVLPRTARQDLIAGMVQRIHGFREQGYAVNGRPPWTSPPTSVGMVLPHQADHAPLVLSLGGGARAEVAQHEAHFVNLMRRAIARYLSDLPRAKY